MRPVRVVLWLAVGLATIGAVFFAAGRFLREDPERVFAQADAAFRSGNLMQADALLRRLERVRPPNPLDRLLRGEVAAGLGRDGNALVELAAIGDETALAPLARLKSGDIELKRGRARAAEAAFLAAIRLLPRSVQPRKQLVFLYSIQRRQAELDKELTELMELDAVDFAYALHWTKTRNVVWNPQGDLASLEKFVATDREDRWSRLALVEALRRLDRIEEAERWIAELPVTDPAARAARVSLRMERGDFAGAEAMLAGGPEDSAELARLRGQLAIQRKDGVEAVRQFRIALQADPVDRLTLAGLGTALLVVGKPEAAKPYLETARRHDAVYALVARAATEAGRGDRKLPHELGMACAAAGRELEARAWLRLAIQHDPLDREGQRMLYDLEHGGKGRRGARPAVEAEVGPRTGRAGRRGDGTSGTLNGVATRQARV